MTCRMIRLAAVVAGALTSGVSAQSTPAPDHLPPAIPTASFERWHRLMLPTTDELADFWDLPWEISVHAAREKAAAQDKPILAYFGANGSVLGAT